MIYTKFENFKHWLNIWILFKDYENSIYDDQVTLILC